MAAPPNYGPPELLDHSNRQAEFIGLVVGFTALATFLVMARMYTRACLVKSFGPDDWTILVGMLCLDASCIVTCLYMKSAGIGYHVWDIKYDAVTWARGQKFNLANQLLYNPILSFSKASLLLFYRRLSPSKTFHNWIWATMWFTIGLGVSTFLADLFQCIPVRFFWTPTLPGGKCFNQSAFYFSTAGFAVLADIWILILPMPVFWGLQISVKRRLLLMGLFALGFVVVIVSAYRLNALHRVMYRTNDPTYDDVAVWSSVELCVSVICCSIPALRPLFARLFPAFFGSVGLSKGSRSGQGAAYAVDGSRGGQNRARAVSKSYNLEEMGVRKVHELYGGTKTSGTSNDSEEMIIGKSASELQQSQRFDGHGGESGGNSPEMMPQAIAVAR